MHKIYNKPDGLDSEHYDSTPAIIEDKSLLRNAFTRFLENYLQRQPHTDKIFACIGVGETLSEAVTVLRVLGWIQERQVALEGEGEYSSVSCLLIAVNQTNSSSIEQALTRCTDTQLILVHAESGAKKTPCLEFLEARGFHILYERGDVSYLTRIEPKINTIEVGLRLNDSLVQFVLQKSQRRISNLPKTTEVELLSVEASLLLVPERFDIAIKAHYARLYRDGLAPSWRNYVYREQAVRITGPGQDVCEHDGSGKSGIKQFTAAFHRLLEVLPPENIPIVPVDDAWIAFDGAHRIAAAIVMARDIQVARIKASSKSLADADFFSKASAGNTPCAIEILDEAAIEYCRIKSGLVLAMIFPTVASESTAIEELERVGRIVYRKDVLLTPSAGMGLLRQAYLGHAWAEDTSKYSGFMHKVKSCFPFSGVVRAVLLDGCPPSAIRPVKERIRAHYGVGNHSIHITDGDDEVLRMAQVLFNENSTELLRLGLGAMPGFHTMLFSFRDWIENNNLDAELFCIDGSAVLSLLDLRECRDLDFLFHGNPGKLPETPARVDCHNDLSRYHSSTIADIVGDPRLHCWYMGLKFCAPRTVLEMKENRGENKDYIDVGLLRSKLPLQQSQAIKRFKSQVIWVQAYCRIGFALALNHLKKPIRPLVRKLRQYCENK